MTGLFQRVGAQGRAGVRLEIDAAPVTALEGDALLVAIPTSVVRLRESAFGNDPRACPARSARSASAATGSCWAQASERARPRRSRRARPACRSNRSTSPASRTGTNGLKESAG